MVGSLKLLHNVLQIYHTIPFCNSNSQIEGSIRSHGNNYCIKLLKVNLKLLNDLEIPLISLFSKDNQNSILLYNKAWLLSKLSLLCSNQQIVHHLLS